VGFVVDKEALGQVFSEYFGFPCQSSFYELLHNHHHLSSGAGTIGQQWPTYQVDSVSPHPEKLKKKKLLICYRVQRPRKMSITMISDLYLLHKNYVRTIPTAVYNLFIMQIEDFWFVTLCKLVRRYQVLGGTSCLRLQSKPEDGSSIFLRNTGTHLQGCMVSQA
jgi:hypothetical protein